MKQLLLCIVLLSLLPFTYSLDYYIDGEVTLSKNGDSRVKGTTNIDILEDIPVINEKIDGTTSGLTTKKGKYWLFSIDSKQNLSASFIKVNLPKGAIINYIKSPLSVNIATNEDIITATFFGENKQLEINIQYSMKPKAVGEIAFIPFLILIIVIALGTILFIFRSKKKSDIDTKKLSTIKSTLNETQIRIIDTLLEKKGQASQTSIQYMTSIPKASLSRNIELLAQKEIIQKFYNGTSNHIKIHPNMKK